MVFKCLSTILVTLALSCALAQFMSKDANYGPYDAVIEDLKAIRGPKQKNLTSYKLALDRQTGEDIASISVTFFAPTVIEQIKVRIYLVNETAKSTIWKQSLPNPCKHFVFGVILDTFLNTGKNCVVKKGNFELRLNLPQIARRFFGTSFFYGKYFTTVLVYSQKGNIFGATVQSEVKKTV